MHNCRNYAQNSRKAVKTLRETDIVVSKNLGCNKQKYSPLGSKNGGLSPRRRPPPTVGLWSLKILKVEFSCV